MKRNVMPRFSAVGLMTISLLFVYSCRTPPVTGVPHVSAYDQIFSPDHRALMVANAVSVGAGWVVVFADHRGVPGDMQGFAPVHDGLNLNIPVSIRYLVADRWYIVQLHKDAGETGKFEFPGADEPVPGGDGTPVMDRFFLIERYWEDMTP